MATRSRIAIEHPDGSIESIYCHWDGYPENNGVLLREYYRDREKVEKLIALGDISYLEREVDPDPDEDHTFVNPQTGVVVAYRRDRGEKRSGTGRHASQLGYFQSDIEEYGYLFTKEDKWIYVSYGDRSPRPCSEIKK